MKIIMKKLSLHGGVSQKTPVLVLTALLKVVIYFLFSYLSVLPSNFFFLGNTEGIIYYSSGSIPNYTIQFEEDFSDGFPFPLLFSLIPF